MRGSEPTEGDSSRPLTTGDLARACETTVRTVRFYEEAGVLIPTARTQGGHRLFGQAELEKLRLIMDLREAGLSLQEIRALFKLRQERPSAAEAAVAMAGVLEERIEQMQTKIAVLRRLRGEFAATVAVIDECKRCHQSPFPEDCAECDVMTRDDLPRAVRLLWRS